MTLSFISIMSLIGTVAFAISGAMVAIEREMDIFGVNILAVTTAVGGGMIRDILIGETPPVMFRNPVYVIIAVIVANLVFLVIYSHRNMGEKYIILYEKLMFWMDAFGLAAFAVDGVSTGMNTSYSGNLFLVVFVGTLTGVGGGLLRDMMANRMPVLFVKHVYAVAALIGALLTAVLWNIAGKSTAMFVGFVMVIIIRFLAKRYDWNMPRIKGDKDDN